MSDTQAVQTADQSVETGETVNCRKIKQNGRLRLKQVFYFFVLLFCVNSKLIVTSAGINSLSALLVRESVTIQDIISPISGKVRLKPGLLND